jgi:hypothetical protein
MAHATHCAIEDILNDNNAYAGFQFTDDSVGREYYFDGRLVSVWAALQSTNSEIKVWINRRAKDAKDEQQITTHSEQIDSLIEAN